jgi:hypothetical protein
MSSLCAAVGLLLAAGNARAAGFPRSLQYLQQTADLVVVGTASVGAVAGTAITFSVQVQRVVVGDGGVTGKAIPVTWNWEAGDPRTIAYAAKNVAGTGLWFLTRSENGWVLLPLMQGASSFQDAYFPEPPGPISSAYSYAPRASPADAVASEVGAVIESAGCGAGRLGYLHKGALDQLNSPVIQVLYQRLAGSTATCMQALGLAGQIRGGDTTALRTAAQAASSFEASALENGVLLASLQHWFRAADPASVGILGKIVVDSEHGSLPFRRAAAFALAAIHTKEALPYLSTLMEDEDPELRAESVRGLGSFANGLPVQTMAGTPSLSYLQSQPNSPFRTANTEMHTPMNMEFLEKNESTYLAFWKAWWQTNHAALGY